MSLEIDTGVIDPTYWKQLTTWTNIADASGLTENVGESFLNSYEDNYGLPIISIWILLNVSAVFWGQTFRNLLFYNIEPFYGISISLRGPRRLKNTTPDNDRN